MHQVAIYWVLNALVLVVALVVVAALVLVAVSLFWTRTVWCLGAVDINWPFTIIAVEILRFAWRKLIL